MGDGVKGHITKGPIHAKVDAVLNRQDQPGGPFVRRAAFLAALIKAKVAEDYLGLIQAEGVNPVMVGYLRETWYGTTAPKGRCSRSSRSCIRASSRRSRRLASSC